MDWIIELGRAHTSRIASYMPTNGIFAEHLAAFMATLAFGAAFVFCWRMWDCRYRTDPRRFLNFMWLALMFLGIAGNRTTVVFYYKGYNDTASLIPLTFNCIWAFSTLMLARAFTIEYCGNKGWILALAFSLLSMFLLG